jgi:fatty acid desaturase
MNTVFKQPSLVMPDRLSREETEVLGRLNGWRFSLALACDLTVFAAAIAVSERFFFNPFIYACSVVLIGSRLHAFGVLMHDCVHYRAYVPRRLNMFVGNLLGWLVLTNAQGYRDHHLTHHRHLNTERDPDWTRKITESKFHFPKRRRDVLQAMLYQLSGLGILELFFKLKKGAGKVRNEGTSRAPVSKRARLLRPAGYVAVLAICGFTGTIDKLALYWLVPMLTAFPLIFYVRSLAEHHGNLAYDHTYTNSRTTVPSLVEGFLILPHNVGYHLEHHLYPHVPFFRLKELHRLLMQRSHYAEKAHVTHGVSTGLLREIIGTPRGPSILEIQAQQRAALAE